MSKEFLDWTVTQGAGAGLDMLGNALRKAIDFDAFENKTRFKARALTNAYPLNDAEGALFLETDYNAPPNTGSSGEPAAAGAPIGYSQYIFKARIIGENSPHVFIPDPCDDAFMEDPEKAIPYVMMHTSFVTDVDAAGSDFQYIKKGDIVIVELERNEFSYNLQFGKFVRIANTRVQNIAERATEACASLEGLFAEGGAQSMGSSSPAAIPIFPDDGQVQFIPKNTGVQLTSAGLSFITALREQISKTQIPVIVITSGLRSARAQAAAIHEKRTIHRCGPVRAGSPPAEGSPCFPIYSLYSQKSLILQVLQVSNTVDAMEAVFQQQMDNGQFLSRHMSGRGLDLRTHNLSETQKNLIITKAQGLSANAAYEGDPPHIHVGIPSSYGSSEIVVASAPFENESPEAEGESS